MAFHHSGRHGHGHHKPCCCCGCCCSCSCSSSSCCQSTTHPAIHSATATAANDPLLQAIAARLFHSQTAAPPHHGYHLYNQGFTVPQHQHPQQQQQEEDQKKQRQHKYERQVPQPQAESLIESLLGRIAALESALPHLSPPPPPIAAMPDPPPPRKPQPHPPAGLANPRRSLRDLAARTIQAHFRLYLVRRSQALRHLKHLAAVRSHVVAIKSSLSDQANLNPEAVSRQASDLLRQVDSIQNTDPNIREGKRSISRELVQLLELVDGLPARRHEAITEPIEIIHKGIDPLPFPFADQSRLGAEERAGISTTYGDDDEESDAGIPGIHNLPSKPGKRVNFSDRVNASRVYTSARSPFAAMNAEWGGGDGRSGHASDEERSPSSTHNLWVIRPAANGSLEQKGSRLLGLSAPTPVQMEPRRGDPKIKISAPV